MAKGESGFSGNRGGGKLPELEGSEKQIAWAEEIRERIIHNANSESFGKMQREAIMRRIIGEDINVFSGQKMSGGETKYQSMMREFKEHNSKPPRSDREALNKWREEKRKVEEKYETWLKKEFDKKVKSEKSAKWWIDNRY